MWKRSYPFEWYIFAKIYSIYIGQWDGKHVLKASILYNIYISHNIVDVTQLWPSSPTLAQWELGIHRWRVCHLRSRRVLLELHRPLRPRVACNTIYRINLYAQVLRHVVHDLLQFLSFEVAAPYITMEYATILVNLLEGTLSYKSDFLLVFQDLFYRLTHWV
jgi:hypothetical protein